ncbi:membrane protein CcdC involved in cytochrome C biogenesis [Oikeobacillus pervagus]|uniref:Membrane protein CcdC involved in cytochrome C biogenesis n=1 Tax=Oikeobacillus pervagus TaxID=1325931 RepID=A0AAJ1T2E4_9BACI|nr:cytochrome c biogenesis protein CcdC [Oikeobacillus pervagus]MDQ0214659.1 membrane protein CcdC involved in cytochrome C biogenesis [Oikeobacillus pervagus]
MLIIASTIMAVIMGTLVIFVRMKAAQKPTSVKKIILPPFFMSTGALMYIFPQFRLTSMEIIESIVVGLLFSIILIKTSNFEIKENDIYLKRSKAFIYILIALLVVRLVGKVLLSSTIEVGQLSGMFFLLAFAMIVPWRIAMYLQYRKLLNKVRQDSIEANPIS